MPFAYFIVLLSVLALLGLLALAKGHWFARNTRVPGSSELQLIDVEAFRNLVDEDEEAYLRERLPSHAFRRIQRERMLAGIEYVKAAYANAGILVRIAEAGRESEDPQVAEAANKLFGDAVQLRWYTLQVIPRLYFKMLFPSVVKPAPRDLFDRYDFVTRQALVLGRLGSVTRNV